MATIRCSYCGYSRHANLNKKDLLKRPKDWCFVINLGKCPECGKRGEWEAQVPEGSVSRLSRFGGKIGDFIEGRK